MLKLVGKPNTLKELNSSVIKQLIDEKGPLSKPQIAKLVGLSLPTVNKLVDDLEAQHCVRQVGTAGEGAGRKAKLYETDRSSGCLVALYYRWGKYICRITDITGQTLHEAVFPLDNSSLQTACSSTIAAIDDLIKKAPAEVKAIGVGVPGVMLPDGSLSGIPKIEVWEGYHLADMLEDRYQVQIWVENDVKLAAVGYYYANLEQKHDHLVYIYAGNGMGSGIILNRKLFRGGTNFAGELGFMAPLCAEFPKESYVTKGGYLESQMRQFVSSGCETFETPADSTQREALVTLLAGAAANYVAVINPDAIVFGGEAFDNRHIEDLLQAIYCQMSNYIVKESMPQILYDSNSSTGIEGLLSTCRAGINQRMQLVQAGGV